MKKLVSLVLALCMVLSLCAVSVSANEAVAASQMQTKDIITIMVDGKYVDCASYGQTPVIVEGRTLVPLRSVFEALGATVEWNNEMRAAISEKGDLVVVVTIDSKEMMVGGTPKAIDVPAQIMNGRTMVPVRAVAEAFGCKVEWDNNTRTVVISTMAIEQDAEVEIAEGTPEAAFIAMWDFYKTGDLASAEEYLAEGIDVESLINMDAFVSSVLGNELDKDMFAPEQFERLEACARKIVEKLLSFSTMSIVGKTEADADTVILQLVLNLPNIEEIDEGTMAILVLAMIAENGYSLEEIGAMSEEERIEVYLVVIDSLADYMCQFIEENIESLPVNKVGDLYSTLKRVNGKWIIVE